jgi:hypothetical protein
VASPVGSVVGSCIGHSVRGARGGARRQDAAACGNPTPSAGEEQLSEASHRSLSVLLPLLNRFTLIEFKGPTDRLRSGDLAQLVGCCLLWHSQQAEGVSQRDISLIVLAPSANQAFGRDLGLLGCQASQHQEGVARVAGLPFATWLVETDRMPPRDQPILSLVSRVFLKDRGRITQELRNSGHDALLHYVLQQVQQFRNLGEDFAMQHRDTQYLEQVEEELQTAFLATVPRQKLLEHLTPEERLRGLPAEEVLRGLSEEELSRLRELLARRP